MRILKRPFINTLSSHIVDYPTPVNISYLWGFGSTAGIFLSIQLISRQDRYRLEVQLG